MFSYIFNFPFPKQPLCSYRGFDIRTPSSCVWVRYGSRCAGFTLLNFFLNFKNSTVFSAFTFFFIRSYFFARSLSPLPVVVSPLPQCNSPINDNGRLYIAVYGHYERCEHLMWYITFARASADFIGWRTRIIIIEIKHTYGHSNYHEMENKNTRVSTTGVINIQKTTRL